MAVIIDITDGARATIDRTGWTSAERIAKVTEVTGSGYAKFQSALSAVDMPQLNAQHPSIPNLYVSGYDFSTEGTDIVVVRIIYTPPDARSVEHTQIKISATATQQQVNTDIDGNLMTVYWQDEKENEHPQSGMVNILSPQLTLQIQRIETSSPGSKAMSYIGTVNSGGFNADPGALARHWLCTGIEGNSSDGGQTYVVTYSFQYNRDGWDAEVVYVDPKTGRVPDNIVGVDDGWVGDDGEIRCGRRSFQVYSEKDFNALNI